MIPPDTIDVLDQHNGFTALTTHTNKHPNIGNSLWRPGDLLKRGTVGTLVDYREDSFYQNNDDVTVARYKVAGYNRPVLCWFDNSTGNRIA